MENSLVHVSLRRVRQERKRERERGTIVDLGRKEVNVEEETNSLKTARGEIKYKGRVYISESHNRH